MAPGDFLDVGVALLETMKFEDLLSWPQFQHLKGVLSGILCIRKGVEKTVNYPPGQALPHVLRVILAPDVEQQRRLIEPSCSYTLVWPDQERSISSFFAADSWLYGCCMHLSD